METRFDSIDGLEITETVAAAMRADGIEHPTPVQLGAIGAVLAGQHVLMHSGTGTGKTLAYLLPLLQWLRESDGRAVVFAPGAELAMQTLRVANAYKDEDLTTAAAISTSSQRRQRKRVQRSTRLVVGTPDRLTELFRGGKLKGVRLIVLDELDPILASRTSPYLSELLSRSEPQVQLVVASATLGKRSEAFVSTFMPGVVRVEATEAPLLDAISHHVVRVRGGQGKEVALARYIEKHRCKPAIVFATEARHLSHLFHYLGEHGITVDTLSRDRTKDQRRRALQAFRRGEVAVLLTTDSGARGLDVPEVDWVLHYDLPRSVEAYVHRAGRTGRAGRSGRSVVIADAGSQGALRRLTRELGVTFAEEG